MHVPNVDRTRNTRVDCKNTRAVEKLCIVTFLFFQLVIDMVLMFLLID